MAEQFSRAVEYGLKLAKRIHYGKELLPPKPHAAMEKSLSTRSKSQPATMEKSLSVRDEPLAHLPTAPAVYAAISEPSIVDDPDVASYQPYVHGRCEPPALIPLQMQEIAMDVDCYLDTAFVTVTGTWRVHCVLATKSCECRVAIPMGEQGSLLGVEVDAGGRSFYTQLITMEDMTAVDKVAKAEDGGFLTSQIFILKVPQKVYGGSCLSLKVRWSQSISYHDGEYCLCIPFSFPAYVVPTGKVSKREKIQLNAASGIDREILCRATSHPLKELRRGVGKFGFLHEAEVRSWSVVDFNFSYTVSSEDICGGLLVQSPSLHDFDEREMFCLYLLPGRIPAVKVFSKEVVFVVDISGSMRGAPLENVKASVVTALSEFDGQDYFNIIAFNEDSRAFSSSLVRVTPEVIERAAQWIDLNFVAEGGTNILSPLNQAMDIFSNTSGSIPIVFLVTDGAVEDEKHICSAMKDRLSDQGSISPRISTFGIGSYCNHYFLQMLAQIGRGYYDAAYDLEIMELRLQRWLASASSVMLANITIDGFDHLDAIEFYPSQIPDLVSGRPLVLSGRFKGKFPDSVKAKGVMADLSNCIVHLKLEHGKDIPLDKVLARRHIDILTTEAWLFEDKQIEEKASKLSRQSGFPSEYTRMVLLQNGKCKQSFEPFVGQELNSRADLKKMVDHNGSKIVFLRSLGVGFGNLIATAKNFPPGIGESKLQDNGGVLVTAASSCCGRFADRCCCLCFIQAFMWVDNQCSIAFSQLCAALACFECLSCCFDLCVSCD